MSNLLQPWLIWTALAGLVSRPNHAFSSLNQVHRRTKTGEDKLRRTLDALRAAYGDPLVVHEGRRLALTPLARDLARAAEGLLAVGKDRPDLETPEVLRVALAAGIDPELIAAVLARFAAEWDGLIGLEFLPLDPVTVRDGIAAETFAFGVGFPSGGGPQPDETLEPGLEWTLLCNTSHRLAAGTETVGPEDFVTSDRVFVAADGSPPPAAFLAAVNPVNRFQVGTTATARALVARGLGVCFELLAPSGASASPCIRRPLAAPPECLGLYLPRNSADVLSDPAKFLLDALRSELAVARCPAANGSTKLTPEFVTPEPESLTV